MKPRANSEVISMEEGRRRGFLPPIIDRAALAAGAYTDEAKAARIEGKLVIKCEVLTDGTIRRCRQLQPLPYLGDEMVRRLEATRATPATFKGAPIAMEYIVNFLFKL